MEQHPVPQNISSYEFRLVGDMTLKQFFQLAGGVVLGILFYRLPIITIVRYPLVFLSVVTGVLMAFVPLQGRPFTQWIVAFIHAIYSPTEFTWAPPSAAPKPEVTANPTTPQATPSIVSTKPVSLGIFQTLMALISDLMPHKLKISDSLPSTAAIPTTLSKPLAAVVAPLPTDNPQAKVSSDTPEVLSLKTPGLVTSSSSPKPVITPPPPPSATQTTSAKLSPQAESSTPQSQSPDIYRPSAISSPSPSLLPSNQTVFESTPAPVSTGTPPPSPQTSADSPTFSPTKPDVAASDATVSNAISTPTSPNILSGLVLDPTDKILGGATIEIVDAATGIPVRALRSNRLGQFQIAIPLPIGSYIINIEKENFVFDPVAIKVANSIIQPIMIKARSV